MTYSKPKIKPGNPRFSSGPTSKHPGWTLSGLETESLGRSHRAAGPKARIQAVSDMSRKILGIPEDYLVGLVPASDTGAFEMAMWNMLGAKGVDVLAWESFGQTWLSDIQKQLKLKDVRFFDAPYGDIPDLSRVDFNRDVVYTWNGTTSGARVPNDDWIPHDRTGLTFCDATSAAFALEMDWEKQDVITWSWQKVLGGEAGHGMLALSPRAVDRLESYSPPWPLPKIFRLTKGGKLQKDIFSGSTINTPSMLAVEDQLEALTWAESIGGLPGLQAKSRANLEVLSRWVDNTDWIDFLVADPAIRSSTSICLKIADPWFTQLDQTGQNEVIKKITQLLENETVAYDIGGYRDAPPGLRIWGGATVEKEDIQCLTAWLDWAFQEISNQYRT